MNKEKYELLNDNCIYDNELKEYVVNPTLSIRTYLETLTKLLNQQDTRIKELEKENQKANIKNYLTDYYLVEKENQQFKQSQKQFAVNELEKLSKHFVYSGDEMVSDYDLDCYVSELKEEIEQRIKKLKGEE